MSGYVDDIVTNLIMTYNDNTYVDVAECATHRKGLQETVTFSLGVRGVNVITSTLKIAKFRCGKYCTSYHSTPYSQPGTHVLGA